eukprot:Phypoly_transcript_10198.p1 GENE.Phypoly_transcript_10198~~Phypoly_transcript_10198.p1  ORF type:complete len:140 (-),score=18.19 Phypoly_transcript_10198:626-1045(-)
MPVFTSKIPDISIPTDISLPDFIVQNFHLHPSRKILVDPISRTSYTTQQAQETINKVAAGFHKKGLRLGDVVAICLPNVVEYPLLMCGIQKLGGIPTTMNPTMIPEEMKYQIKDSGAIYFVTIPQLMDKVSAHILYFIF